MEYNIHSKQVGLVLSAMIIFLLGGVSSLDAQIFPVPGFTLPPGKTICITYEVDVNLNIADTVCQISNQGSVSGTNFPTVLTDDPMFPGISNPTITFISQPAAITLCPNDTTVTALEGQCIKPLTYAVDAIGCPDVTISYQVNESPITFPYDFPVGVTVVTVIASTGTPPNDTCTFAVTVEDIMPPDIVCNDLTLQLDISGNASFTLPQISGGIADNCDVDTVFLLTGTNMYTCLNADQTFVVVVQVTDVNGNTATCSSVITILDDTNPCCDAPIAICQDITIAADDQGIATVPADQLNNGSIIDCGLDNFSASPATIACPVTNPTIVILLVTDLNGNTATCIANVTVVDTLAPSIICPPDITIECGASTDPDGGNFPGTGNPTVADCDPNPLVSFTDVIVGGACPQEYTITRVFTATDFLGQSSTCDQTITIDDSTPPTIECAPNVTVECFGDTTVDNTGMPIFFDNCDPSPVLDYSDTSISGNCPVSFFRIWTTTDACGNSTACQQLITIDDTTPPTITCPTDVTIECDDSTLPANNGMATATDNCDPSPEISFTDFVIPNKGCAQESFRIRTWTATDNCGNTSQCTQFFEVVDTTPPVITCPPNLSVSCPNNTNPFFTGFATATDNCDETPIVTRSDITISGQCNDEYTINRTWVATDDCFNSSTCLQVIMYVDTTFPNIVCPANVTISCASQVTAPNTNAVSAFDVCDGGSIVITHVGDVTTNMTCINRFTLTRTYRATDGCGNSSTCAQIITVNDVIAPIMTCPANLTLSCSSQVPAPNTALLTATDNCGAGVTITHVGDVNTNMTCTNSFILSRTYRATDACGNSSTCTQTILVNDIIVPTITCPANITVSCANQVPAVNIASATATDNCGPATISHVGDAMINVTCPNRFTLNRTYRATDACGNSATCTQVILVNDQIAPMLTCPSNITVTCASDVPAPNTATVTSTDNCGGTTTITFVSDVSSNPTCANRFNINRTYRATDACGNSATCIQVISVFDNVPPTLTCPMNVTVQCASQVPAPNVETVTASDNCSGTPSVTFVGDVIVSNGCVNRFTVTRTYRATDICGNSATCNQTITVFDNTAPTITCPATISVQCANQVPAPNIAFLTSTDNCGGTSTISFVSDVVSSQTCVNRFTLTRTYRATDECGNSATCNQIINVFDNTVPTLTCPANVTVQCASLVPPVNTAGVSSTDNCGGVATISHVGDVVTGLTCTNRFTLTRTYRATDECGNSATCAQVISVFDNTPPSITCPASITIQCANQVPAVNTASVVTSDNCGGAASVTHVGDVITNQTCANRFILTRTYRSTDVCGNSSTCAQVITVFDNTPPVVTCPANLTVQCAAQVPVPNIAGVVTSDNCGEPATVVFVSDVISNQTCINRFIVTRSYRATDVCGNSATCVQVITVLDNTPPVITFNHPLLIGVPNGGTIEIQCFGQDPEWEPPVFDQNSASATDNCAGPITFTYSETFLDGGNCPEDGYINRYQLTWNAFDACGNSSSASVFLELIDTIPPVILGVPDDITVNCNEIPEPPTNITATDECQCACIIEFNETNPAQGCQNGQIIVRSWTAIDDCGNETIETQNITLVDEAGPVLEIVTPEIAGIQDGTILQYTCNEGGIPDFFDDMNAESVFSPVSCGNSPLITFDNETVIARNCKFFGYVEQRIYEWTGIDACGNETILAITVQLIDDEAPVLLGVPEMTCVNDPALDEVEVTDNCENANFIYWDVEIPNPCGNGIALRRTYEGFDPCGNTVRDTAILIPDDNTGPTMEMISPDLAGIGIGEAVVVNCTNEAYQYTLFGIDDVKAGDACSSGVVVTFEEKVVPNHDCLNGAVATGQLIWTATDMCGNSSQIIIPVNVIDETDPVFVNFEVDITIGCNEEFPENFAVDNCGEVTITYVDNVIQGACENEYEVLREVTATDPCGNTTTRLQRIHVGDGSGPIIEGVEEELCDDLSVPKVTAYDPCADEFVEVTMEERTLDIKCIDGIVIERVWNATDRCGNVTEIVQTIIINDQTPPEIQISSYSVIRLFMDNLENRIFLSQSDLMNQLNELNEGSIYVKDDCDREITPDFTLVISYADDCELQGYFERREYTWIATDVCGNFDVVTFVVEIMDDVAPVLSRIPKDTVVICTDVPMAPSINADDTAQPVVMQYSESTVPGNSPGEFNVTRNWTATDACGNVASGSQTITWIPDTFLDCDIILTESVECNSHGVPVGSIQSGGLGALSYEWEVEGEKCFIQDGQGTPNITLYVGFGDVEISLTVTDAFGCFTTCSTTLTCIDPFDDSFAGPSGSGSQVPTNIDVPTTATDFRNDTKDNLQEISLWPNPANESVNLSFESRVEVQVELRLLNFLGQVIFSDEMYVIKGFNLRKIDVAKIPDGSYMLEVKTNKEIHSNVIVIIR